MATWRPLPNIYSCGVCMEHLLDRNPRFLSCHHYYCQSCLQRLAIGSQVSCPECREITTLTNNDVTKLSMNFPLVQVMEREQQLKLGRDEREPAITSCHFCDDGKPNFRCTDCYKFLCHECKIKHNKMKRLKSHNILEYCQKHMDVISHVCLNCSQALCVKCFVLDHAKHEDKVQEYTEGVNTLKSDLQILKNRLKEKNNIVKESMEQSNLKKNAAVKERLELQNKRDDLVKQIEEIDNKLQDVKNTENIHTEDFKMYEDFDEKCTFTYRNIDTFEQAQSDQIIAGFREQKTAVEKLMNEANMHSRRSLRRQLAPRKNQFAQKHPVTKHRIL